MQKQNLKEDKNIERKKISLILSIERTLLSKQRTVLAEINVFAAFIGLTILVMRFFIESTILKIAGVIGLIALTLPVISSIKKYFILKEKIHKIDKRNGFH